VLYGKEEMEVPANKLLYKIPLLLNRGIKYIVN
jgi:hypothetical protein